MTEPHACLLLCCLRFFQWAIAILVMVALATWPSSLHCSASISQSPASQTQVYLCQQKIIALRHSLGDNTLFAPGHRRPFLTYYSRVLLGCLSFPRMRRPRTFKWRAKKIKLLCSSSLQALQNCVFKILCVQVLEHSYLLWRLADWLTCYVVFGLLT